MVIHIFFTAKWNSSCKILQSDSFLCVFRIIIVNFLQTGKRLCGYASLSTFCQKS